MGADTFLIIPEKKTSNEQQKKPSANNWFGLIIQFILLDGRYKTLDKRSLKVIFMLLLRQSQFPSACFWYVENSNRAVFAENLFSTHSETKNAKLKLLHANTKNEMNTLCLCLLFCILAGH